jgi:hypothetical protein
MRGSFGGRGVIAAAAALLAAVAPVARATTTGSFNVSWTDRVGNPHPLVDTQVSLYDVDASTGNQTLVGTWVTDSAGKLTFSTNYARAGGGSLQLSLDVKAVVTNVGTAGTDFVGSPFEYRLPGTYAFAPNSFGTTYTPAAVDNSNDAGKAVGFMQGLKVASDYYRSLGASVPYVQVRFGSQWGTGSYMNGSSMNLGYDSWGAWDVAFHEFGHGVANQNQLHIGPTLGYSHSFNQDDITSGPALGPAQGTQLAWQEGIATYMGTSALHHALPAAISGMPASDSNASYDRLSSTGAITPDASATFNVHLENKTAVIGSTNYVVNGKGEGDELSVARILWDLDDNTPNESLARAGRTDQVSVGGQGVYNLMKAAGAGNNGRLNDLWHAARVSYGTSPLARSLLGDVFEANSVSSIPGAPGGVTDGGWTTLAEPTLAWTPQNSGHSDKFLVAVYSQDWSSLLELSPEIDGSTCWQLSSPLGEGTYNWVVISNSVMQDTVSFDDSYWSGAATFVIVPEPGVAGLAAAGLLLLRRPGSRGRA